MVDLTPGMEAQVDQERAWVMDHSARIRESIDVGPGAAAITIYAAIAHLTHAECMGHLASTLGVIAGYQTIDPELPRA